MDEDRIPPRYKISLWTAVKKPIRKFFAQSVVPFIPFNGLRVACYRLCGFKVGGALLLGCDATSTTSAMTRLRLERMLPYHTECILPVTDANRDTTEL